MNNGAQPTDTVRSLFKKVQRFKQIIKGGMNHGGRF